MGYVTLMANCIRCGRVFGCNPRKVPSIRVDAVREPVCEDCYHVLAAIQKEHGMAVLPLDPDAYRPMDESEL